MKKHETKTGVILGVFTVAFILLPFLFIDSLNAQEMNKDKESFQQLEKIQDENMDYLKEIYRITKNYPDFSYNYTFDEDGSLKDVTVTGVENEMDRKRLEVVLFDLKSNRNQIKNKQNRIGVFYTVDKTAKPKMGDEQLRSEILKNLTYPEDAIDWGVEGTIYVKFVVDENGKIPFITTDEDVNSKQSYYVKELEKQAIDAVMTTSGEWTPAQVDGVNVASLAMVPVTFEFKADPDLPDLIR